MPTLTDATLAIVAGSIISILAAYVPGFNVWYQAQDNTTKRLQMLVVMFLTAVVLFAAGCANLKLPFGVACTEDGAVGLALVFIAAVIANQSTFSILPVAPEVKALKAIQKADTVKMQAERQ